jgi:hypothetical protein
LKAPGAAGADHAVDLRIGQAVAQEGDDGRHVVAQDLAADHLVAVFRDHLLQQVA